MEKQYAISKYSFIIGVECEIMNNDSPFTVVLQCDLIEAGNA
jgi:hypothetical protein